MKSARISSRTSGSRIWVGRTGYWYPLYAAWSSKMSVQTDRVRSRAVSQCGQQPAIAVPVDLPHNSRVRRYYSSRSFWRLALFTLLLSICAPEALATWQCEGRTCGTTLWFCCCVSPTSAQDGNCPTSARPGTARGGAQVCPSQCQCVLTVAATDTEATRVAATVAIADYVPAIVSPRPELPVPVPTGGAIRTVEGRGPPPRSSVFATPSLRAPPFA